MKSWIPAFAGTTKMNIKTQSQQDIYYMQQAILMAKKAREENEVPVGAVAVLNDEIIAQGYNCPIKTKDPTAHAEIITLRNAAKKLDNYRLPEITLYVTLEPCIMCVGAMLHARIKRLVFGALDSKTGAVMSVFKLLDQKNQNHKIEYIKGILASESAEILTDFFKAKRHK